MNDERKIFDLKREYNNIEISKEIDSYVQKGIMRGRMEKANKLRKSRKMKYVGSVAAVFIAFVISVNTIPAFADTMYQIPGVGKLVQVMRFNNGSTHGGTVTDGSDIQCISLQKEKNIENIIINFTKDNITQDIANYFKVDYSEYPYTLTFSIPGARQFSAARDFEMLKKSNMIQDVYRLMSLDDSMVRFAVTFNGPINFEVLEYKEPAQVVVSFRASAEKNNKKIYSLRSSSYPYGEELGMIEESLMSMENKRILKDIKGNFLVEAGYFDSIEEANSKMEELSGKYEIISKFYIEERGAMDLPK